MNEINLFLHRTREGDRQWAMNVISKWESMLEGVPQEVTPSAPLGD